MRFITNISDYQEIPSQLSYTELHFWSPFLQSNGIPSLPTTFCWLTAAGIYAGRLSFGNQSIGDSVARNAQLFPYPGFAGDNEPAISIASTEFHYLVLFPRRIVAICSLNHDIVYDHDIELVSGEQVLGMTVDVVANTIWLFTTVALYEILVRDEDRDVWMIYLKKQLFDDALTYAKVFL